MSTTVGGNAVVKKTKRVFYSSGTAYEGYGVNYNWDAMGVDAENNAFTTQYGRSLGTTLDSWCDARNIMVEDPDHLNNLNFAGVVDKCSDGVTGPNWIQINTPGSICKIFATQSGKTYATLSTTAGSPRSAILSTLNTGHILNFSVATVDNGEFTYSGFPGRGAAKVLQVASSTDCLIMAELMDGPESGGVQKIAVTTAFDASAGVTIMQGGVTLLSATCTGSGVASATLSAGAWIGMKKRIAVAAANSNFTMLISADVPLRLAFTTGPTALAVNMFVSCEAITILSSSANEFVNLEWDGTGWLVLDYGPGAGVKIT